jgi:protoheme IX farnesyltransferase
MKPGIVLGNLITLMAGFMLASKGSIDLALLLYTILGLCAIMASGCIFNNYIDRHIDSKMERTRNRALASGAVKSFNALLFAALLGACGGIILLLGTNVLTFLIAVLGFIVYVCLYSLWKCHTIHGTAIGAVAGAVPPLVGYVAVSGKLDAGAMIFFGMMLLWQMPHFFAIAIRHFDDYAKAGIPVLPLVKGIARAKSHMLIYVVLFVFVAMLLTVFEYTGYVYLTLTLILGVRWLLICMQGFKTTNDQQWATEMFRFSLVTIVCLSIAMSWDTKG